ncbi:fibronectin-like [Sardina pilchardus]|uniref:fibronectin-like n=1 Tax=Sardina pilchardus TaxID=27697 RepID=UPI002E0E3430
MDDTRERRDTAKESVTDEIDEKKSAHDESHEKDIELRRPAHVHTREEGERQDVGPCQIQPKEAIPFPPVIKSIPDNKSHKPVPSVLSMKSDQSKHHPENFKGDIDEDIQIQLAQPDSSSIVSEIASHSEQWISSGEYYPKATECVQCDVCQKKAVKSCLTCIASFCESHVRQHYTAPALKRHKLTEATEALEQRLCQRHDKDLDLFCQTDSVPVCALCSVEEHKGHDMIPNPIDEDITQVLQLKEQEWCIREDILPPGPINFTSVNPDSISLSWEPPEGLTGSQGFRVSVKCSRYQRYLEVQDVKMIFHGLIPQEEYNFMFATICGGRNQSIWVSESIRPEVPVPKMLNVTTDKTSIEVTWSQPDGLFQVSYLVTLKKRDECLQTISTEDLKCLFSELQQGTEYTIEAVTVLMNGYQSKPALKSCHTVIPVPENLKVDSITVTTANLSWSLPEGMGQILHNYQISYRNVRGNDSELETIYTDSCSVILTGLKPCTEYNIWLYTNIQNIERSQEAFICILTGVPPVTDLTVETRQNHADLHFTNLTLSKSHQCHYLICCHSDGAEVKSYILTPDSYRGGEINLTLDLKCNQQYTVTVTVVIKDGRESDPASATFETGFPSPGPIEFTSVKPYSVSLVWGFPEELTGPLQFRVSWFRTHLYSERPFPTFYMTVQSLEASIDGLLPNTEYSFSVTFLNETGIKIAKVSADIKTGIPAPVDFKINVEDRSCTWKQPPGVSGETYQLSIFRDAKYFKSISTTFFTCPLSDLNFDTEYTILISTSLGFDSQSKPLSETVYIETPIPQDFDVISVSATSAELHWGLHPIMEQIPHSFLISYHSEGAEPQTIFTDSCSAVIAGLEPDTEYIVCVSTIIQHGGGKSKPATTIMQTGLPAPGPIQFSSVSLHSVSLCWEAPKGMAESQRFRVSYTEKTSAKGYHCVVPGQSICVENLASRTEYEFSVATISDSGRQSVSVLATTYTEIPVPENVVVVLNGESAKVSWNPTYVGSYLLTLCSDGKCEKNISTTLTWCLFHDLQLNTDYTISLSSVLPNGRQSKLVQKKVSTRCVTSKH